MPETWLPIMLPCLEELATSSEHKSQINVGPNGPVMCEQDQMKRKSHAYAPRGPENFGSSSASDSHDFWAIPELSKTSSFHSKNFQANMSSVASLGVLEKQILPDLDKLHIWEKSSVLINERNQKYDVQYEQSSTGEKTAQRGFAGRSGSGWHEVLLVAVATVSAILIVDHGELRDD